MKRNRWLALPLAAAMSLSLCGGALAGSFPEEFAASRTAMVRYWLPGAPIDLEQMKDEIRAMAEAGFAGIELACVSDSGTGIRPENRWDTENWYQTLVTVLETAKECGIKVDLTVSAHWPLIIPGLDPDGPASQKVLTSGLMMAEPGQTLTEAPASETALREPLAVDTLKAVVAGKVLATSPVEVPENPGFGYVPPVRDVNYILDPESLQSIPFGEDGSIDWTAPEEGEWAVIGYWQRGNLQQASGANGAVYTNEPAYVVDHFSMEGTQAFIDYWEENLLTEEVRALLQEVGGSFFEDSLEVSGSKIWTDAFLARFEEKMGYDLTPYLPALEGMLGEDDLGNRVTQDYEQVLYDLYEENHLLPIQAFANSLGMTFRSQAYGGTVDSSAAAAVVDIIEGELLTFGGGGSITVTGDTTAGEWIVDNKFKVLRGGANMASKQIVSDEIGSMLNGDWVVPQDRLLEFMNGDFSAGVNHVVIHGYSYEYFEGASWPTGMTFSPVFGSTGFGTVLSKVIPNWETMDETLAYINGTQFLLQAGKSDVDVAIYRDETSMAPALLSDGTLVDRGYTYDYISPANLVPENPNAAVTDGVLAAESASYKALIVFQPDGLLTEGLAAIEAYAKAGLPIVFVGSLPAKTRGYSEQASDASVTEGVQDLLSLDNVVQVEEEAQLSEALGNLGVLPDTAFSEAQPYLATLHRSLPGAEFYYLYNRGYEGDIQTELTLKGSGEVYEYDAYSGKVTRRMDVTAGEEGTVSLPLTLESRNALCLVVSGDASYGEGAAEALPQDTVLWEEELAGWNLSLEEWKPAAEDVTSDEAKSDMENLGRFETLKETHEIAMDEIRPWSELEGYELACGIGTYTAKVQLDEALAGSKAILNIGEVASSFEVFVNGQQVKANLISKKADITDALSAGENEIVIVVPSEMINALTLYRPEKYEGRTLTVNGLQQNPVLTIWG